MLRAGTKAATVFTHKRRRHSDLGDSTDKELRKMEIRALIFYKPRNSHLNSTAIRSLMAEEIRRQGIQCLPYTNGDDNENRLTEGRAATPSARTAQVQQSRSWTKRSDMAWHFGIFVSNCAKVVAHAPLCKLLASSALHWYDPGVAGRGTISNAPHVGLSRFKLLESGSSSINKFKFQSPKEDSGPARPASTLSMYARRRSGVASFLRPSLQWQVRQA